MLTKLCPVLDPTQTTPHIFFLPVPTPCLTAVGSPALTAHEKIGQSVLSAVFPQYGSCLIGSPLPTVSPCHFHLYGFKNLPLYDRGMIVRNEILCHLAAILFDFFGDAVLGVRLLQEHIAAIALVGKDILDLRLTPFVLPLFGHDAPALQTHFDSVKAIAVQIHGVNGTNTFRLFGNDLGRSVLSFPISQYVISEGKSTRSHPLLNTPTHICTDIFALRLCQHTVQANEHLAVRFHRIKVLFLEKHPHPEGFELTDIIQTVYGIPRKTGDRLR